MRRTQIAGAILACAVLVGMFFVPESIGLGREGINTLGVLIAIIIALVTEPLPLGIVCMLGVPMMVVFGTVPNIGQALSGYTNHILFLYWFLSEFPKQLQKYRFPNVCWYC